MQSEPSRGQSRLNTCACFGRSSSALSCHPYSTAAKSSALGAASPSASETRHAQHIQQSEAAIEIVVLPKCDGSTLRTTPNAPDSGCNKRTNQERIQKTAH